MQKVSKGFATWAGTVGALGGLLLALATFMNTFDELDPLAGLGPLAAAAGVLWKVIDGRMKQATALAAKPAAPTPVKVTTSGGTATNAVQQLATATEQNTAALQSQYVTLAKAVTDIATGTIGGRATTTTNTGWPTPGVGLRSVPGEFDRDPTPQLIPKDEQRELPDCA